MKQYFLSRFAIVATFIGAALAFGSNADANPFGKGNPGTKNLIIPPDPIAPPGSALQSSPAQATVAQANAKPVNSADSNVAMMQTKRYADYAAYPAGSDQRNLLAIAELYTGVLRRVPDYQGLGFWASSLNPNASGLENAARNIISAGFPQFLTTTDYQYRRSVIWSIYWYAADIPPGTPLPYHMAAILDSIVYDPNMSTVGAGISMVLHSLARPDYPRFENRVSLALILGWEEQYPIYWDTYAFAYVTNDYQTVLDYAATH
jgi:hypothetical protein